MGMAEGATAGAAIGCTAGAGAAAAIVGPWAAQPASAEPRKAEGAGAKVGVGPSSRAAAAWAFLACRKAAIKG